MFIFSACRHCSPLSVWVDVLLVYKRCGPLAMYLLPGLGIVSQENAGRAVAQEDGHRVVVGLAKELAGWRSDDMRSIAIPASVSLAKVSHRGFRLRPCAPLVVGYHPRRYPTREDTMTEQASKEKPLPMPLKWFQQTSRLVRKPSR
jgi:hypothetical protein